VLTKTRVFTCLAGMILAAGLFTLWQVRQVQGDLDRARSSVALLQTAIDERDVRARDDAIADLQEHAASAADRTEGRWWGAMTWMPFLGDDVEGIRALSDSLATVAEEGVEPLSASMDMVDGVFANDRIDVEAVARLHDLLAQAQTAFDDAAETVSANDSSTYLSSIEERYDDYATATRQAADALASAETATLALPAMLGSEGPRNYLLLFQNNAEIRATGGLPGSWALAHADNGEVELVEQGTAADFPLTQQPVLPLTEEEISVYGDELGTAFQNPGLSPDFPRAAELWNAHWALRFPGTFLDGVIALDPVAMSYLLDGTGPVPVGDQTLTSDNILGELLNRPYIELDPLAQDALFQEAARAIFNGITGELASPVDFVEGLSRASREGRLLVAPFDAQDAEHLADSRVTGVFPGEDGTTPHVDIGLNDATGAKMSYYLRYRAEIEAQECAGDHQELSGTMTLHQTIPPSDAAQLPESVTGDGQNAEPGSQLLSVRIYGPYGGTVHGIRVVGEEVVLPAASSIEGRPVATVPILLESTDDVVISWTMDTGPGQTADGELGMTPGVVPGSNDGSFDSAC
jgi:hypothetical protein